MYDMILAQSFTRVPLTTVEVFFPVVKAAHHARGPGETFWKGQSEANLIAKELAKDLGMPIGQARKLVWLHWRQISLLKRRIMMDLTGSYRPWPGIIQDVCSFSYFKTYR